MARKKGSKNKSKSSERTMVENLKQVAYEYGRTKRGHELADEMGVSRTHVYSWAAGLRAVGVDVPRISRAGIFLTAAKEIQAERPELIKDARRIK